MTKVDVERETRLLTRLHNLPSEFEMSGNQRNCRRYGELLLYDSECGSGWRELLLKTYWELLNQGEAYWELIAIDSTSEGFASQRTRPVAAVAVIPSAHLREDEGQLIYISPEDGKEQELHPSRYVRFSDLLEEGEKARDHPELLVERAVQRILPPEVLFKLKRKTFEERLLNTVGVTQFEQPKID